MGYVIYKDVVGIDTITIHKDTCKYYTGRKRDASISEWVLADMLEDADKYGEKMANSNLRTRSDLLA